MVMILTINFVSYYHNWREKNVKPCQKPRFVFESKLRTPQKRIGAHPMLINSVYLLNASDLPQSGTVIQAVSGIPCKVSTGQQSFGLTLLYHTVSNLQASKSPSGVVPDL